MIDRLFDVTVYAGLLLGVLSAIACGLLAACLAFVEIYDRLAARSVTPDPVAMQAPDLTPVDDVIGVEDADCAIRLAEKLMAGLPLTESDLIRTTQDDEWCRAHGWVL